jgi:beta-phosphoglucomutase-like phosphatase (HAD superfamily)
MTVRGLVFDVDGTLADTEELHRKAFNAAFAANDLPWFWGRRVYCELLQVAGGRERIAHFIDAMDVRPQAKANLRRRIATIHADKTRFYTSLIADGRLALREGVEALIQEARHAGLRLALATTTTRANVDALIAHTLGSNALEWFALIATSESGAPKKPAPDVYLHVLDRLGLRPRDVIAFEDSANGLTAAKRAGLFTVVTPTTWTANEDLSSADIIRADLADGGDLGALRLLHARWLEMGKEAA